MIYMRNIKNIREKLEFEKVYLKNLIETYEILDIPGYDFNVQIQKEVC
jgi:hypothetical protein